MGNKLTTAQIADAIAKGKINPDYVLTNMAIAYYQDLNNRPASFLAPHIPVGVSTGKYYIFAKEDLLRDAFERKPMYGSVAPTQISRYTGTYECEVDQMMLASDIISQTNDARLGLPGTVRTAQATALTMAQHYAIHMDRIFANKFFKKGVWDNEWTGKESSASESSNEFLKFTDANSNPIQFFRKRITDMKKMTGKTPNRLGLGIETFNALVEHPVILSRISGNSSAQNPAQANEEVLAKLFGIEKVGVFDSISNEAEVGADAKMDFICDSKGALLAYTPDAPSLMEPSAAYTFAWDMLGDGKYMCIAKGEGAFGEHVEKTECIVAPDMRITANDLGIFMTDCI